MAAPAPAPTRWWSLWAVALAVAVALVAGHRAIGRRAATPAPREDARPAAPAENGPAAGPATPGTVERRLVELTLPEALRDDAACGRARSGWRLPGYDPARARATLDAAGLAPATRDALLARLACGPAQCDLDAPDAVLLALPAEARGRLYRELARVNGQDLAATPFHRPLALGTWEAQPGVAPAVRDVLARLTWTADGMEHFADLATACRALPDRDARAALLALVRRRYTYDVAVRVGPGADADAVARYWAAGRPVAPLARRFREAQRAGAAVPLRELLPAMPRQRLAAFPSPGDAAAERDCLWTTRYFFDADADAHPTPTRADFAATFDGPWRETRGAPLRFGDALVLYARGVPVHAMVYLADDLVFTKNGRSAARAWVVNHLSDMRLEYPGAEQVRVYRRAR